jgi:hypothetical protein
VWSLIRADDQVFATSDHPVHIKTPKREKPALNDSATYIGFPVSPDQYLLINAASLDDKHVYRLRKGQQASLNYNTYRSAQQHLFTGWEPTRTIDELISYIEAAVPQK